MKTIAATFLALLLLPGAMNAQAVAYDYSKIYEQANPAIVTVTTDDGSGSGFLVTSHGHIATNFHVIRNSKYLAVQFSDGRKVRASVIAVNAHYDMALVKVNSTVVKDIRPLPLLSLENEASVKVGIPVLALGSPLNQKFLMTQGILSKVEEAMVLGDFLLHHGNSGGPLLNSDGEVIGINTFAERNIAGAIRVGVLRAFIDAPELMAASMSVQPPDDQLPSVTDRYPVDILNQKIQTEQLDWEAYRIEAGDFTITAITPVLIGKLHVLEDRMRASNRRVRRAMKDSDDAFQTVDEPYYEWHSATETAFDYAITFDIRPNSGPTKKSPWAKFLTPLHFFKKGGKAELEFKAEFLEFRLYRDGKLLEPVMPGRAIIQGEADPKKNLFVDQAFSGSYVYSPDEFLTGSMFKMEIIDARQPDVVYKVLTFAADSRFIKQVRADFTYAPDFLIMGAPR